MAAITRHSLNPTAHSVQAIMPGTGNTPRSRRVLTALGILSSFNKFVRIINITNKDLHKKLLRKAGQENRFPLYVTKERDKRQCHLLNLGR